MARKKQFEDYSDAVEPIMEKAFNKGRRTQSDSSTRAAKQSQSNETDDQFEDLDIANVAFPELSRESGKSVQLDTLSNIPINVSVELGRSQISLKEVYELSEGAIIELERLVGEPLDLVVNGQVIAQGEVVAIDNNYGLRITAITANQRS